MDQTIKNMESILSGIKISLKPEQTKSLDEALEYIKNKLANHESLHTKINHALEISAICINEIDLDHSIVLSSMIFYCLPKSQINLDETKEKFGLKTSEIITGLMKIPDIKLDKLSIQSENFIKLLLTISTDISSILLKLAEMLYLLRSIGDDKDEHRYNTATVIAALYAPIAHRLGLYAIKTEMEDLSMKFLHPQVYREIAKKLEESKESRNQYIKEFIAPLKNELFKNKIQCEIKGRSKSIHSIWNKMRTQNVDFDEVYDKFAIRVIIDTKPENEKNDCWRAYSIITDQYKPNPLRLRDWITSPKSSGYESLHTTVIGSQEKWIEVQIRTARMDEIAEKGHAAHWKYKEKKEGQSSDWLKKCGRHLKSHNKKQMKNMTRTKPCSTPMKYLFLRPKEIYEN